MEVKFKLSDLNLEAGSDNGNIDCAVGRYIEETYPGYGTEPYSWVRGEDGDGIPTESFKVELVPMATLVEKHKPRGRLTN